MVGDRMNRLTIAEATIFVNRAARSHDDGPRAMRRVIVCGAAFVALALPSGATAATLNELPFQALPDRQGAGCLRPTGAAGGLSLFGRPGATDLWRTGGNGTARGERVRLGRHAQCGAVAEAGGAAVAAALVSAAEQNVVRAAARDAGGAFGPAVDLSRGPNPQDVAAAISPAGHAAVVWTERRGEPGDARQRLRVVVARRQPGQGFGAPEPVAGWWTTRTFDEPDPEVALDANGNVFVVWSQSVAPRRFESRAHVAVATPGAAFARQALALGANLSAHARVGVAPDGWSVVVQTAREGGIAVFERPPGAARFTTVDVPRRSDAFDTVEEPAVAVAAGGGAVVAWRTDPASLGHGVAAMTRAPGGAFTTPQVLAGNRTLESGNAVIVVFGGAPPLDTDSDRLRVALGPGRRALLAWTTAHGGVPTYRARSATGLLGGRFDPTEDVPRSLRDVEAVAPLFLDDGRAALAWVDNDSLTLTTTFERRGEDDGRLHLAIEGAAVPAAEAPALRLRAARVQRLFPSDPVRVTATCDRPCDLLGAIRGADDVSVTTASTAELELPRSSMFEFEDPVTGELKLNVRAAEPGAAAVTRRSLRVRVVPRPPLPLRRPLDVLARRRGGEITVRWRTAGPARRMYFSVYGQRSRSVRGLIVSATGFRAGRGRTRFTVRLRTDELDSVRWVTVVAGSMDHNAFPRAVVRVQ
jgi:hypothetical protein